jgi:hypothetical protein
MAKSLTEHGISTDMSASVSGFLVIAQPIHGYRKTT